MVRITLFIKQNTTTTLYFTSSSTYIPNIFKEEFKNTKKTNWELLSEDERNRQLIQMESLNKKYDSTEYLAEGQPTAELRVTRRGDIVLDEEIAVSLRRA